MIRLPEIGRLIPTSADGFSLRRDRSRSRRRGDGGGRKAERALDVGKVFISDLVVHGIIGVNDSERTVPQAIVINVDLFTDLSKAGASDDIADCVDYQHVAEKVTAHAKTAGRFTVEALAADIAKIGLGEPGVERVFVRVEKPGAVGSCRSVGVEIERVRGR
jgi:FolB domain-containing protein